MEFRCDLSCAAVPLPQCLFKTSRETEGSDILWIYTEEREFFFKGEHAEISFDHDHNNNVKCLLC